jgi:Protein of unknown function (DUF3015)
MRIAVFSLLTVSLVAGALLSISCTANTTTDLLSSTTPGVWYDNNGMVKEEYKAVAFTTLNFENVKRDLARGEGEYLASLGSLLGVRTSEQQQFFSFAQHRAAVLVASQTATPEQVVTTLKDWPSPAQAH